MRRRVAAALGLLALLLGALVAAPPDVRADDGAAREVSIPQAIEGLDSDDYFRREEATRRLLAAGAPAIAALTEAAAADKLEVTCRAVAILRELLLSADEATSE